MTDRRFEDDALWRATAIPSWGVPMALAWTVAGCVGCGSRAPSGEPPLPLAVTNNAVVAIDASRGGAIYSLLGLDATKAWSGITRRAFRFDIGSRRWSELPPVPGDRGRLAATAQVVRGKIYLFGGYTVDASRAERSVPNVDIWDPDRQSWTSGTSIPVPVDDAVSGVWRDSLIYLVSGWHDTSNVTQVQVYDPLADRWFQGTPIAGPGVFGHAGGIAGNVIVYIDGVQRNPAGPKYTIVAQVWRGEIDPADPSRITWRRGTLHPGPPLYRAAAGSCGRWVLFAGGTDNPYNYNGVGYDGLPAEPRDLVLGYDITRGDWRVLGRLPEPTMDHRALAVTHGAGWIVGGMRGEQRVSNQLARFGVPDCGM